MPDAVMRHSPTSGSGASGQYCSHRKSLNEGEWAAYGACRKTQAPAPTASVFPNAGAVSDCDDEDDVFQMKEAAN